MVATVKPTRLLSWLDIAQVACPACEGHGGASVTRYWGRGPNECYPDYDECDVCEGTGKLDPDEAAQVEALIEDTARYEDAIEAERPDWDIADDPYDPEIPR